MFKNEGKLILDSEDHVVAEVWSNGDVAKRIALLTAAPEMLDEHRKTLAWLEHVLPQAQGKLPASVILGFAQAIRATRAAIAKAEGKKD